MMRIGDCADATAAACVWLEEIDGLMTSAERGPIETNAKVAALAPNVSMAALMNLQLRAIEILDLEMARREAGQLEITKRSQVSPMFSSRSAFSEFKKAR